jgi:TatD DNase family protein
VKAIPFIDIHTHHAHAGNATVKVVNLFPGDDIPAFSGRNFYSVGLHPWCLKTREENSNSLLIMEDVLEFDHVLFAGECGLDKISGADFQEQKRVFMAQAIMAEEYQKPLIIHCVRAYNEIIELYNSYHPSVPWIFHNYTGNREISEQLLKNSFFFLSEKFFLMKKQRLSIHSGCFLWKRYFLKLMIQTTQ